MELVEIRKDHAKLIFKETRLCDGYIIGIISMGIYWKWFLISFTIANLFFRIDDVSVVEFLKF
jgi:hypothetical protein